MYWSTFKALFLKILIHYSRIQSEKLQDVFANNEILLLTETWLGDETCVQVNGFKTFQLNRTLRKPNGKRNSGGIIAYIRYELVSDKTL